MENNGELIRLERFVDKLLTQYNNLKEKYLALEVTLQQRDKECANLKDSIAELRSERSAVSDRVAALIERIVQWENEQEDASEPDIEDPSGMQGKLFTEKTEAAE